VKESFLVVRNAAHAAHAGRNKLCHAALDLDVAIREGAATVEAS